MLEDGHDKHVIAMGSFNDHVAFSVMSPQITQCNVNKMPVSKVTILVFTWDPPPHTHTVLLSLVKIFGRNVFMFFALLLFALSVFVYIITRASLGESLWCHAPVMYKYNAAREVHLWVSMHHIYFPHVYCVGCVQIPLKTMAIDSIMYLCLSEMPTKPSCIVAHNAHILRF